VRHTRRALSCKVARRDPRPPEPAVIPAHRLDGPAGAAVVVLSNSLGATWDMWEPQLPALTSRFRVLRYDQRGHGATATPGPGPYTIDRLGADLIELLDHLELARASLTGVSLGGMVALWVAVHHPERVERLVLACTAAELGPPESWLERAAAVRASSPSSLRAALLGRWFTPGYPQRHPGVTALVDRMLGATDAEGYAGCCEAIAAMDQRGDLARVSAPTLVVAGAEDPVTPPARAQELQSGIAGASLLVLPGAAHLANIEQADAFNAALVDHLEGLAATGAEELRAGPTDPPGGPTDPPGGPPAR